jgi:hypothetical protein
METSEQPPLVAPTIAGLVQDLMSATRIESAAGQLGFRLAWLEIQDLHLDQAAGPQPGRALLGEPLRGPAAHLVDWLSRLRPSLILFDLGAAAFPWREWLPMLKSAPATRRYPVVCFGSHVETEALVSARRLGAEAALPRSRFFAELPVVIEKYARRIDQAALHSTCDELLSAKALHGLELFNQGEYFEAHEWLEHAWNEDHSLGRDLYRGVLQAAVAYLHIQRGNYAGAMKLFLRMRQWLDGLPAECRGVQVQQLRQDVEAARVCLEQLGPERMGDFPQGLFRPIEYRNP